MDSELKQTIEQLKADGRLGLESNFFQHGGTTVLDHSVNVADISLRLVKALRLKANRASLIRGALLHDYFLYDWHDRASAPPMHGFSHPQIALKNARADFKLTPIEENIILRHMFPLTPIPPSCKEAWIVCAADKYCALAETLAPLLQDFAALFQWPSKRTQDK